MLNWQMFSKHTATHRAKLSALEGNGSFGAKA